MIALLEHVERRAGDALGAESFDQRGLVDDWPRETLMKYAVGFMRANAAAPTKWRVVASSNGIATTKSDSAYSVSWSTCARRCRRARRRSRRVGGEELQVEHVRHAQDLLADAPGADDPERAAGEPHAHVVHPLVPAGARQAVLVISLPASAART
jgi:hypothetical protein